MTGREQHEQRRWDGLASCLLEIICVGVPVAPPPINSSQGSAVAIPSLSRDQVSVAVVVRVQGHLFWGDVRYVVLDEADTMFDKGFGPEVRAVLGPLRSKANPAQVVLVVATLSQVRCI